MNYVADMFFMGSSDNQYNLNTVQPQKQQINTLLYI